MVLGKYTNAGWYIILINLSPKSPKPIPRAWQGLPPPLRPLDPGRPPPPSQRGGEAAADKDEKRDNPGKPVERGFAPVRVVVPVVRVAIMRGINVGSKQRCVVSFLCHWGGVFAHT